MAPPLHVACFLRLSETAQASIRGVDPRIRLRMVSAATTRALFEPEAAAPDAAAVEREVAEILAEAEVWFTLPREGLRFARDGALRWIQLASAGADRILGLPIPRRVVLTNASGIGATPIGEWVLAFLLMHAKRMPQALEHQRARRWKREPVATLRGATVGIVGLGAIGAEVARLCRAFGMRVVATRRTARAGDTAPDVDALYPMGELPRLLGESDYVVLCVPLTPATRGLMGAAEFAAMRRTGVLVNIARGAVVDWAAQREALRLGQIAAVYTDVTAPEPLPAGDADWAAPHLFITAHNSGNFPGYFEAATAIFTENLRRYLAGEPLRNPVDRGHGY